MAHLFHVFSFSFTSLSTSAASAMPKCHASTLTEQFADLNKTYTNLNQPSFLHLHQVNSRSVVGRLGTAQNWCGFSLLLPVAQIEFLEHDKNFRNRVKADNLLSKYKPLEYPALRTALPCPGRSRMSSCGGVVKFLLLLLTQVKTRGQWPYRLASDGDDL